LRGKVFAIITIILINPQTSFHFMNKTIKKMVKETKKKIGKFDLEHSVGGGPLKLGLGDHLNTDNIILTDNKKGYLIHVQYSPKDRKYRFDIYEEKK
jgi:hypothetical protein